ncbi:MAG: HAMP domain-containing sensor histidine kinase [Chloroflexi bacterium]|nr:HAMP domain-containing sensor histidine kinase [Chloroflexota bacterium]
MTSSQVRALWRYGRYAAATVAVIGLVLIVVSPVLGDTASSDDLWLIEPIAYIGGVLLSVGSLLLAVTYIAAGRSQAASSGDSRQEWSRLTREYFDIFGHDLGRPLRRILGRARDARVRLDESGREADPALASLIDEIEQQAPTFRLMVSNVQVLIELEDPGAESGVEPTDPARVIRNIVDRYSGVARDRRAEITWWSEPQEFGVVYTDPAALDHVVTNLVDNAVKHVHGHIEIRLTRNPTHFFVRVWDDGDGIAASYLPHAFDRGWTPEAAGRQERSSSGLGLFIARTLVRRSGGDVTLESTAAPAEDHHTEATIMLPLRDRPE